MALEGLKVGFTKKDLRREIKERKAAEPKGIKLNFKTVKRASKPITRKSSTIDWCEAHTEQEITEAWKRGFIKKKLSPIEEEQYKDLCYYLEHKFNCSLPKRSSK